MKMYCPDEVGNGLLGLESIRSRLEYSTWAPVYCDETKLGEVASIMAILQLSYED